jgi:hypothetical protein
VAECCPKRRNNSASQEACLARFLGGQNQHATANRIVAVRSSASWASAMMASCGQRRRVRQSSQAGWYGATNEQGQLLPISRNKRLRTDRRRCRQPQLGSTSAERQLYKQSVKLGAIGRRLGARSSGRRTQSCSSAYARGTNERAKRCHPSACIASMPAVNFLPARQGGLAKPMSTGAETCFPVIGLPRVLRLALKRERRRA